MALALAIRSCGRGSLLARSVRVCTIQSANKPSLARSIIGTNSLIPKKSVIESLRNLSTTQVKLSAGGGGNHATLWTIERGLSLGLLGIVPVAIAFPSQALDALLSISMVMHFHWGLEAVVTDYVRPILVGNVIPKVAHGMLLLFSAATLGGLFYFIYNDVGVANAIRKLWAVKGQ